MKEKKLSKDELVKEFEFLIAGRPRFMRNLQADEQIKSLIEYADQIETTYANMADEIESSKPREPSK